MEERLKKQMDFLLEVDKLKFINDRRICLTEHAGKTMRNIPGTWP